MDSLGQEYYINSVPRIAGKYGCILEASTMVLMIITYWFKASNFKNIQEKYTKIGTQVALLVCSVSGYFLRSFLPTTRFNTVFFVVFLGFRR